MDIKAMTSATIQASGKNQIYFYIPKEIQESLDLKVGNKVSLTLTEDNQIIVNKKQGVEC